MFMLYYRKRKKFTGEMLWIYLAGYGIGRVWIEGLRTDQLLIPGTSVAVSQILSILVAAAALFGIWRHRKVTRESEEKIRNEGDQGRTDCLD